MTCRGQMPRCVSDRKRARTPAFCAIAIRTPHGSLPAYKSGDSARTFLFYVTRMRPTWGARYVPSPDLRPLNECSRGSLDEPGESGCAGGGRIDQGIPRHEIPCHSDSLPCSCLISWREIIRTRAWFRLPWQRERCAPTLPTQAPTPLVTRRKHWNSASVAAWCLRMHWIQSDETSSVSAHTLRRNPLTTAGWKEVRQQIFPMLYR